MSQISYRTMMLEAFRKRMYWYIIAVVVIFLVLVIQLINLQIVQGEEYSRKARSNMENYIPIAASRGEMYDRNHVPGGAQNIIVSNRPSFNLTTIPAQFKSKKKLRKVITNLCTMTGQDPELILEDLARKNPWERVVLQEDVSFETIVKVASYPHLLENIDWEDAPVRIYHHGPSMVHVTGYIGIISPEQYRKLKGRGYRHYQKIGKNGLEFQYDNYLRGKDGFVRRIVDVRNRTEGEVVGQQSVPGSNMVLTIDSRLQLAVHKAMENLKGSVVVMRPSTGEVLSLLSKPDYDPNMIISRKNNTLIRELYANPDRPFLDRAIQSKYPPASTFKLVTAIAGLETEKAHPGTRYYCSGKYTLKGYKDHDFYCYAVHGSSNLIKAISDSCSVYFYQYGLHTGPTSILKYARYLGLNEKTGIDLPGEVKGFIPSKKWKLKTYGQTWFDGDTVNLSIGQGFLAVTPIAMANFISGIVNNGIMYQPRMVNTILTPDNRKVIKSFEKKKLRELPLSPLTLKTIKQGMRMSVTAGTCSRLRYLTVPLTGKSGTAQTRSQRKDLTSQHAWYVGYGPYEAAPENSVVVAVMIEYGITGATTAVPVAFKVYQKLIELGYVK